MSLKNTLFLSVVLLVFRIIGMVNNAYVIPMWIVFLPLGIWFGLIVLAAALAFAIVNTESYKKRKRIGK